jgi:predicted HAD superfamily phosphohydrolase YqeG
LLTDVLGAKLSGLPVVWVQSLGGKEHFITRCTRKLEKFLINRLVSSGKMPKERVL